MELLRESSETIYLCTYHGLAYLWVINVKTITSVVAMIPMTPRNADHSAWFFLLEKPGLEIQRLGGMNTDIHNE
jgi:hypothetical protein